MKYISVGDALVELGLEVSVDGDPTTRAELKRSSVIYNGAALPSWTTIISTMFRLQKFEYVREIEASIDERLIVVSGASPSKHIRYITKRRLADSAKNGDIEDKRKFDKEAASRGVTSDELVDLIISKSNDLGDVIIELEDLAVRAEKTISAAKDETEITAIFKALHVQIGKIGS